MRNSASNAATVTLEVFTNERHESSTAPQGSQQAKEMPTRLVAHAKRAYVSWEIHEEQLHSHVQKKASAAAIKRSLNQKESNSIRVHGRRNSNPDSEPDWCRSSEDAQ